MSLAEDPQHPLEKETHLEDWYGANIWVDLFDRLFRGLPEVEVRR